MGEDRGWLPQFVAGLTVTVVFLAVLTIILTAAGPDGLHLTERQTSTWIFAGYGLPMIPSLILTLRHRTPMLLTGNIFAIIFFASLGSDFSLAVLAGAAIVAGAILLATTVVGVTEQVVRWIPVPVVYGLIGGAVLPFVVDLFSSLNPSTSARGGADVNVGRDPGGPTPRGWGFSSRAIALGCASGQR